MPFANLRRDLVDAVGHVAEVRGAPRRNAMPAPVRIGAALQDQFQITGRQKEVFDQTFASTTAGTPVFVAHMSAPNSEN
jgi:hypothetical protein